MNVEINGYETKKMGNRILESAQTLEQNIKKLYGILDEIEGIWQGSDALSYLNVMRNQNIIELEKLQNIIQNYGDYLTNVPDVYQALDEVYSSISIG